MRFRRIIFLSGFVLTLVGLIGGSFQFRQYTMIQPLGCGTSHFVMDDERQAYALPFEVGVDSLYRQYYKDGQLKQAVVALNCTYQQQTTPCTVSVNHPAKFLYYHIYLQQYQLPNEQSPGYVHLMLVRQPLLWMVYLGLVLLMVCSLWWGIEVLVRQLPRRHAWFVAIAVILVAALIVGFNPMMRSATVPPVLRSVWFLPHVIAYILSFALLALSFIGSIRRLFKDNNQLQQRVDGYLQGGTALFTIGLALGMIWAKVAWGNFWSWDPKETFALVTWVLYMVCVIVASRRKLSPKVNFMLQLLAFFALQMCWYGINWLPNGGLHV